MEAALTQLDKATTDAEKELDKIRDKLHGIETIVTKNMSLLDVKEQLSCLKGDLATLSQEYDHVSQELRVVNSEHTATFHVAKTEFEKLVSALTDQVVWMLTGDHISK